MVYVLEKKLSSELIQKIVEETKAIRSLRYLGALNNDRVVVLNLQDNSKVYIIDHVTHSFLTGIGPESVFDETVGRYLFYFQNHYYFFSIHDIKNVTIPKTVMFYKETPPPRQPDIYQQLIEELKQAFICGGGIDLLGWDICHDDEIRRQFLINERTQEVLTLKFLDELDDIEKTNNNFR